MGNAEQRSAVELEAIARLIAQFKPLTNWQAILTGLLDEANTIEEEAENLRVSRDLEVAVGDQLDKLGELIGEARNNKSDDVYRIYIKARMLANRSNGLIDELNAIARFLLDIDNTILLEEFYPASMTMTIGGTVPAPAEILEIIRMIMSAKAAGVNLQVFESDEADADTFTFASIDADEIGVDDGFADDAETTGGSFIDVITEDDL